jgi:hypothetical protein
MMVYTTLLAQAGRYTPPTGPIFWRIFIAWLPALFIIPFYILLAVCIYRAAKYFGSAGREQKLLRMEMSKLAEEVHLLRQELEGGSPQKSLTESG